MLDVDYDKKDIKKGIYINGEIFNVNTNITIDFYMWFKENKDVLTEKDISIECIKRANKNDKIDSIVENIDDEKIYEILSLFAEENCLRAPNLISYKEYVCDLDLYFNEMEMKFKEQFKVVSQNLQLKFKNLKDSIVKPFSEVQKLHQSWMNEAVRKNLEAIQNIIKSIDFKKVYENISAFDSILIKYGYPPLDKMDIRYIKNIVGIKEENKIREELDKYIEYTYDSELLINIMKNWSKNSLLKKRFHIISEAVKAHINGKYVLSIPVILSQIEGLLADYYKHKGQMHLSDYRTYIKNITCDKSSNFISNQDKKVARLFILKKLLQNFQHGNELPELSRHAILHGADTQYSSKINSIKLILIFDFLQQEMSDYK